MGKVPPEVLKDVVFKHLGADNSDVVLGPALGVDGAIVKVGDKVLISSMDPITGAMQRIGFLAVNINANDVATFGVRPTFFSSCLLLPEDSNEKVVEEICRQIGLAARNLGIAVIGGHSEVTPELQRPIIVGCAMAVTAPGKYVTAAGSKPGDKLILTKGTGLEGTAVLATEKREALRTKLDDDLLDSAASFYDKISVVKEAVLAYNYGGVSAMHDPTEGGVANGIHELADAAGLGVKIYKDKIYVHKETVEICRFFKIDPLQLISSGALLISADPRFADGIKRELESHLIRAEIIGEFLKDPLDRFFVSEDGTMKPLVRPACDHLWFALKQ
ncbi:MAG: AIR synthase family protein [Candidatus Bathyarchaeia archaeon]